MSKSIKSKSVKPMFSAATFYNAGVMCAAGDAITETILAALEEGNLEAARDGFTEGYVAERMRHATSAEAITEAIRKHARTVMTGCNPEATPKEGQYKRTEAEHNWFIVGKRKFNRAREKLGIAPVSNVGGHGKSTKPEAGDKPEKETHKLPKAADAAEANGHIRNMALMLSSYVSKNKAVVSADAAALVTEFVAKINKLT